MLGGKVYWEENLNYPHEILQEWGGLFLVLGGMLELLENMTNFQAEHIFKDNSNVPPWSSSPVLVKIPAADHLCCYAVLSLSHVWLFETPCTAAHQAPQSKGFSRQESSVGCHLLLQGIFPIQESNLPLLRLFRLLHWQADSLPLSHQEAPLITYHLPFI